MAQFRTTADIIDAVLTNAGEVTNGNSSYEAQVLSYLNRVHFTLIAGGSIPVGKDQTIEIDEVWPWARAKSPIIIELKPKYDTGTVTLTLDSEVGAFSAAPSISLQGYHLQVSGRSEWFKIAQHTAASTAFEIDGAYPDATGVGMSYVAVKLDYELNSEFITVNSSNNKFQFQKTAGVTLTATLTDGVYSPSALATHIATQATTAASGPTITGAYSSLTKKFTLTSNLSGPTVFSVVGNGSQSDFSIHKDIGFDDETTTSAAAQVSTYILNGVCRLIEPFKIHKGASFEGNVYSVDAEKFQRSYPMPMIEEGYPTRFCILREGTDGTITVRFNAYPVDKTRIEVDHIDVPRDLKDNSSSVPRVPRKHIDILEDAATFYLMLNKSDDRAQVYANLLQGKLKAMVTQHRGTLVRSGENFGQVIPRQDMLSSGRRRLLYGERS